MHPQIGSRPIVLMDEGIQANGIENQTMHGSYIDHKNEARSWMMVLMLSKCYKKLFKFCIQMQILTHMNLK